MQEIMKLTALQLGAAIRRGEVSPTEAVKAALERIEEMTALMGGEGSTGL